MKKNGMVALLLMGSISMYGQTTSKMTLSGRVKGFTDTPTLICDLSMEHVKPDTLLIRPDGTFSQEIVIRMRSLRSMMEKITPILICCILLLTSRCTLIL